MKTIVEREAHKWLPLLLDDVDAGEEVVITRNGAPLVYVQRAQEVGPVTEQVLADRRLDVRAAMVRIRERAQAMGLQLDWEELKSWRDEGRP